MPLTEEQKRRVEALIGQSAPPTTPPPVSGTLPPGIPPGQPYLSSIPIGRARLTIPPPTSEMQRQLAFNAEKLRQSSVAKVAEKQAEKQAEEQRNLDELQVNLSTIKDTLKEIPQAIPSSALFGNQASTLINYGRNTLQALDPRFRDATSAVQASVGKFMQTIEKLPRGRLTQGEIFKLTNALGDLPYLSDADRIKRFAIIDQLAGKAGVKIPSSEKRIPLPPGIHLMPGLHIDTNGKKILVNTDDTYQLQ